MKLKCKKIRGIEKNVCTCEQKIAYNYAFIHHFRGIELFNNPEITGVEKSEELQRITNSVIENIRDNGIDKKYNIDAIVVAFRQGFRKYCENYFIATDYKEIGECFKIPYEIV